MIEQNLWQNAGSSVWTLILRVTTRGGGFHSVERCKSTSALASWRPQRRHHQASPAGTSRNHTLPDQLLGGPPCWKRPTTGYRFCSSGSMASMVPAGGSQRALGLLGRETRSRPSTLSSCRRHRLRPRRYPCGAVLRDHHDPTRSRTDTGLQTDHGLALGGCDLPHIEEVLLAAPGDRRRAYWRTALPRADVATPFLQAAMTLYSDRCQRRWRF